MTPLMNSDPQLLYKKTRAVASVVHVFDYSLPKVERKFFTSGAEWV